MAGTKQRIFIIDDNTNFIELQRELLTEEDESIEVLFALNGKEGVEKVVSSSPLPDIIFLDLMLPDMSGYDVLKQLKASAAKDIPVFIITSFSDHDLLSECRKAGAQEILVKPPNFAEFTKTMITITNKYLNS